MTRDTVIGDTPASSATSAMVGAWGLVPAAAGGLFWRLSVIKNRMFVLFGGRLYHKGKAPGSGAQGPAPPFLTMGFRHFH